MALLLTSLFGVTLDANSSRQIREQALDYADVYYTNYAFFVDRFGALSEREVSALYAAYRRGEYTGKMRSEVALSIVSWHTLFTPFNPSQAYYIDVRGLLDDIMAGPSVAIQFGLYIINTPNVGIYQKLAALDHKIAAEYYMHSVHFAYDNAAWAQKYATVEQD